MAVQENLHPEFSEKITGGMQAERTVVTTTFTKSEAGPGDNLIITVPKLKKEELIVPGTLALVCDVDLTGGDAGNYFVAALPRALVASMVVRFGTEVLENNIAYDIYKIFEDFYLPKEITANGFLDYGIEGTDLRKTRANSSGKKTSGWEFAFTKIYGNTYRILLDHDILKNNGAFYPHALYQNLEFEITLAQPAHVVIGSDPAKLTYRLKNLKLQYEVIRSRFLAQEAHSLYQTGRIFPYTRVERDSMLTITNATDSVINIKVTPQKRSLKAVLLLFMVPYTAGTRSSYKYVFPDLTKADITVNGSPNSFHSTGLDAKYMWYEAHRFFIKDKNEHNRASITNFYTDDRFGLLIDMRSMSSPDVHGTGVRVVNSTSGVHLTLHRTVNSSDSGTTNCHVFLISDAQLNIMGGQLESVQN